ncbi:uncharacterized protein BKA78DRAFT_65557 [Phyllosticta capitalensis]|uniref:uncharacterized protein n=1 Tax=Phyllosticta capitalensis TaxID=121624 RepID=UPI003131CCA2
MCRQGWWARAHAPGIFIPRPRWTRYVRAAVDQLSMDQNGFWIAGGTAGVQPVTLKAGCARDLSRSASGSRYRSGRRLVWLFWAACRVVERLTQRQLQPLSSMTCSATRYPKLDPVRPLTRSPATDSGEQDEMIVTIARIFFQSAFVIRFRAPLAAADQTGPPVPLPNLLDRLTHIHAAHIICAMVSRLSGESTQLSFDVHSSSRRRRPITGMRADHVVHEGVPKAESHSRPCFMSQEGALCRSKGSLAPLQELPIVLA